MIIALALALTQPQTTITPQMKARSMRASVFVFPVLRNVVDAIREGDETKFSRHVRPDALLLDADGNTFPLRLASLQSISSTCTYKTMSNNSGPIFDIGTIYWDCPSGLSQLHFKMRDGVVFSASPIRDPATKTPRKPVEGKQF